MMKQEQGTEARMSTEYYLIRKNAVPEVLQKVVEVNKLLESGQVRTVGEAASRIGISRSSYYKFKDDIQEFHDSIAGKTLTLTMDINDEQGVLCDILKIIADGGANILTIHQSIPMSGIANVSISVQIIGGTDNVSNMMLDGLHSGSHRQKSGCHPAGFSGRHSCEIYSGSARFSGQSVRGPRRT